jgi:hypothetical protein
MLLAAFKGLIEAPEVKGLRLLSVYMCHEPSHGAVAMRAVFGNWLASYHNPLIFPGAEGSGRRSAE